MEGHYVILGALALLSFFWSILWALGERDRLRILKVLHALEDFFAENGNFTGKKLPPKEDGKRDK